MITSGPNKAETVFVPLKPICDYLELSWSGQSERIKRDPVLSEEAELIRVTRIKSGRGNQSFLSLPLEYIPGWLFGINANRVKPDLRDKIIRYQRECFRVLSLAFQAESQSNSPFVYRAGAVREREPNPVLVQLREQALEMAKLPQGQVAHSLALAKLADEQLEIEAKAIEALDQAYYAHNRLNEVGKFFTSLDVRLTEVENIVKPGNIISQAQAAEIGQKVRGLAEYLTSKLGPTDSVGKIHYQSIFGELQRRFSVTSYKLIPQRDYTEVLAFLDDWRKAADNKTD